MTSEEPTSAADPASGLAAEAGAVESHLASARFNQPHKGRRSQGALASRPWVQWKGGGPRISMPPLALAEAWTLAMSTGPANAPPALDAGSLASQ
jgi:hypothetical protein